MHIESQMVHILAVVPRCISLYHLVEGLVVHLQELLLYLNKVDLHVHVHI